MLSEERRTESAALSGRASGRLANPDVRDEFGLETLDMNMGPQHPAMHGLLRLILELEKLLDAEIPPRADAIRALMNEFGRIMSHIPSIGFLMLELGAFTPILYAFRERERIQTIFEAVTGARMMFHYIRIGGVKADLPPDIPQKIWDYIESLEAHFQRDFVDLIQGNEIFISRTRNVGRMTQEQAVEMGVTGPALRCTGVDFDIRVDYPYSVYPELQFEVITDTAARPRTPSPAGVAPG